MRNAKEGVNARAKRRAVSEACELLEDGMFIGLGTGSTMELFAREVERLISDEDMRLMCVPTSYSTELICSELGIPTTNLLHCPPLDMAFDGADQVDEQLNAIKGGGAAHTMEKVVAMSAKRFVLVVDESKLAPVLNMPVPVELVPHAMRVVQWQLESLGGEPKLRMGLRKDGPLITDNGCWVMDVSFGELENPKGLDVSLNSVVGLVEHGIFTFADTVVVGSDEKVRILERS